MNPRRQRLCEKVCAIFYWQVSELLSTALKCSGLHHTSEGVSIILLAECFFILLVVSTADAHGSPYHAAAFSFITLMAMLPRCALLRLISASGHAVTLSCIMLYMQRKKQKKGYGRAAVLSFLLRNSGLWPCWPSSITSCLISNYHVWRRCAMLAWPCWPTWASGAKLPPPERVPWRTSRTIWKTPSTTTVRILPSSLNPILSPMHLSAVAAIVEIVQLPLPVASCRPPPRSCLAPQRAL